MHRDIGLIEPVVLVGHDYLNFSGSGADPQYVRRWSNGRVARHGFEVGGKRRTASREQFHPPRTSQVRDRMVYLFCDRDLVSGSSRINLCAVLHVDAKGRVALADAASPIQPHPSLPAVITIPAVIDGHKLRYFAIASKTENDPGDVAAWAAAFAAQPSGDPEAGSNIDYQIGWADFDYRHTFLGTAELDVDVGTDDDGSTITATVSVLKFPVLDPLRMANALADRLTELLRGYEEEFGFHKTLIRESSTDVSKDVNRWSKYRLALMLASATNPGLRARVDEIRHGALNGYLRQRTLVQESYQHAVDLAAGNLATWMQRDVVLAWINLCHSSGVANACTEPSAGRDGDAPAQVCVLEDFARAVRELHQTRPGNVLGEMLADLAPKYSVLDAYLFSGKPMKAVLRTRSVVSSVVSIKKLVFGRLVARGKESFVDLWRRQGLYFEAADVLANADDLYDDGVEFLNFAVGDDFVIYSKERYRLERVHLKVELLKSRLGSAQAASAMLSFIGWLGVNASIQAYAEAASKREGVEVDDTLAVGTLIVSQSLATADLLLGNTLKAGAKAGLKVSLSALGVVVNAVDAGVKAHQADELVQKGDTDAGMLKFASAALIMLSIPLGLFGFWIGTAVAVVAGLVSLVADLLTDDAWEMFLANTDFGFGKGGGSFTPDWAGVTLDALSGNPAFQVLALANLLSNFTVRALGGGHGKRFGSASLQIDMASADPMAVFVIGWYYEVQGEPGLQIQHTVAATLFGGKLPADGGTFRIPGSITGPDGKTSLETFERSAVKAEPGTTQLIVGEPLDMRPYQLPGHRWEHRTIKPKLVTVQRLAMQSFGRPRADKEWFPRIELDVSKLGTKASLFEDV